MVYIMSIRKPIIGLVKGIKRWLRDDEFHNIPEVPFDNRDDWMRFAFLKLMRDPVCRKRPQYVWGVLQGAALSKVLGISRISVIEFGVAGGGGLISMERTAELTEEMVGIVIDVYGFDTGSGNPKLLDYRDVPFRWSEGSWPMDIQKLENLLHRAKLVLGHTGDTIAGFISSNPAPVAFAAFDLTMYSSTIEALKLFEADVSLLLPRTYCMFRSLLGSRGDQCDYIGERLAIQEFNTRYTMRKLCHMDGLRYFIPNNYGSWPEFFYLLHIFDHPLYCRPSSLRQSVDIDTECREIFRDVTQ
jgi:hypothetical protein